jgi:hypothetical protein
VRRPPPLRHKAAIGAADTRLCLSSAAPRVAGGLVERRASFGRSELEKGARWVSALGAEVICICNLLA